jgi:hypothetical protein
MSYGELCFLFGSNCTWMLVALHRRHSKSRVLRPFFEAVPLSRVWTRSLRLWNVTWMTNRFRMSHNSYKHAMWTVPLLFTPMVVFWVVTSCGLAGRYHILGEHALKMEVAYFSEALCLIHHNYELNRHWGWFLRLHSVYYIRSITDFVIFMAVV